MNSDYSTTDYRLPNFFILGAAKAGTTTLYEHLNSHPEIYLSEVKEPQFFCHEDLYKKGMQYYLDRFFSGSRPYALRGEATPHYLYYEKVAQRISKELSGIDTKFIVILRDPVQRAYSLYWNMVSEGVETLPFEEAIKAEKSRSESSDAEYRCAIEHQYVDSGMYARQIRNYYKYFDPEQFLILFFEDLKSNPSQIIREIFHFLGVNEEADIQAGVTRNPAGIPRWRMMHNLLRQPNPVKKALGHLIPDRVKYMLVTKLLSLNKKSFQYPPIDPKLELQIRREFINDILDLESLTGRRLANWLPNTCAKCL
jgi:hypothetical protein